MNSETLFFFERSPEALPLYGAFLAAVLERWPDVKIGVKKTQISFSNRYGFAFVSLPIRRRKDWPDPCIIVTFGLEHRVEDPRIFQSVEPYPRRWTHHVIVSETGDVDAQLMDWVGEAYDYALRK